MSTTTLLTLWTPALWAQVSEIVDPLAAISPLLGVIAAIAIAIVGYLVHDNRSLRTQVNDVTLRLENALRDHAQRNEQHRLKDQEVLMGLTNVYEAMNKDFLRHDEEVKGKLGELRTTIETRITDHRK